MQRSKMEAQCHMTINTVDMQHDNDATYTFNMREGGGTGTAIAAHST